MQTFDPGRRTALASLGTAALTGALPFGLGGCESLFEQIRNRPMRRDLATLSAGDPIVQTYRAAVAAMKALPASNPRSWTAQAQIHFDFCPHGNWFFLPWHRAYLLYFEHICRALTGEKTFALPYWNWTCNRRLPAPFLDSVSNALFEPGRSGVPPAALGDGSVGTAVIDAILDEPNFLLFGSGASSVLRPPSSLYGPLEGNPHNTVHGFVGGIMSSFQSPRDPVFWTHHNMIERVWWEWNVIRGHANTNDPVWTNFNLGGMFVDGAGAPVSPTVGLLNLAPLLSYRYDNSSITSCGLLGLSAELADRVALRRLLEEGGRPVLRAGRTLAGTGPLEVPVGGTATQVLRSPQAAGASEAIPGPSTRLVLRVLDVQEPPTGDLFVRVFVNLLQATADTPITDPHYAGSFAFFSDPGARGHVHGNAAFLVDVGAAVARLRGLGRFSADGQVSIQLVAVKQRDGPLRQDRVRVGGLELQWLDSEAPTARPFGRPPSPR